MRKENLQYQFMSYERYMLRINKFAFVYDSLIILKELRNGDEFVCDRLDCRAVFAADEADSIEELLLAH